MAETVAPAAATPAPPTFPGAKPVNPSDALVKAQNAVASKASSLSSAYDELDNLDDAKPQPPKPTPAKPKAPAKPATPPAKKSRVPEGYEEKSIGRPLTAELGRMKDPQNADLLDPKFPDDDAAPSDTTPNAKESVPPAEAEGEEPQEDAEKEQEATKDEPKPKGKAEGPEQLRNAYEKVRKERDTYQKELDGLRSKFAEEAKAVQERIAEMTKQREDLERELRLSAYERSQEYKEQWQTPWENAFKQAYAELAGMQITNPETGEVRVPTGDDFNQLIRLPPAELNRQAKALFGDYADDVKAHIRKIRDIEMNARNASEKMRTEADVRAKRQQEESIKERQRVGEIWASENRRAAELHPEWFAPDESDPKGNELLQRGFEIVDPVFSGQANGDDLVKRHAAIRNMAAGFYRMAWRQKQAQKRITELEAELAEYRKSEPTEDEGRGKGGEPKYDPASWEQEIDAMDRK